MKQRKNRGRVAGVLALALAFTLIATALSACGSPQNDAGAAATTTSAGQTTTQSVTDMVGRSVEVPTHAKRIIGIGASSLRVISYLQATDAVVGIEKSEAEDKVTCCYRHVYHDTFKDLPAIGDGGSKGTTPNEEAIMQVSPEVIFANIDRDAAESLQGKTGIPVVCVTLSNIVFDQAFYDNLTLVGSIVGKQDRAAELVGYLQDVQADLKSRVADIPADKVASAYAGAISFRGAHGFTGTEAQFPPFVETNVTNIADGNGASGAFDIDAEKIVDAQPDQIFLESGSMSLVKEDYNNNPAYFSTLKAVQNGNVHTLIAYRFYATNVELALANCYQVGAISYPDRFADVDPTKKLDEITEFFLGKKLSADLAAEGYSFTSVDVAKL